MRLLRVVSLLVAFLGIAAIAGDTSFFSSEIARIRQHLLGAERLLLSRDTRSLSATEIAGRTRAIDALRSYRERGAFPHNHVLPDRRTPVFIDEHGTRCAMAQLIESSGDAALVHRIAATANLARIRELAGDRELVAWLDRNGMTLDEAARVQPTYGGSGLHMSQTTSVPPDLIGAAGVTVGALGIALNLRQGDTRNNRNGRGLAGVMCGLIGAGLSAFPLVDEAGNRALGVVGATAGVVSFALGIHQLDHPPSAKPVAYWEPVIEYGGSGVRSVAIRYSF